MANDDDKQLLPKPVDWDEMYPSRFIKASEFKGKQVTLTITAVDQEILVGDKGKQKKGVISFKQTDKQWAINRTNGVCVKAMFGDKVQQWVGKRVTLFPGMHDGEPCIRVWGSPDLDKDFVVLVSLPRKRPFNMTMHRTEPNRAGRTTQTQAAPALELEREPGSDDGMPAYDPELSREMDLKLVED